MSRRRSVRLCDLELEPNAVGLRLRAAILDHTMGEYPVPRPPKGDVNRSTKPVAAELTLTPEQQRAIAHSRGRICKKRGCEICAPLRDDRRLKKAQRKADAQAQLHAKGQPCGRSNCPEPICVRERHADVDPAASAPAASRADVPTPDTEQSDAGSSLRRQAERHRAGLPCGFEHCVSKVCVEGFAQERARRHRARRPCRSSECANPICAASR